MVPINFWRNYDPFKIKEHFSCSKIDQVRAFFVNPSKRDVKRNFSFNSKSLKQPEAEVVPSSSLVEVGVGVILLFWVGQWIGVEWFEKS